MIQRNELEKFTSCNYVWSLDALTTGEVNSNSFRQTGGTYPIIRPNSRSTKTVTTLSEDQLGINVEYFIDNVNIESVVAPNRATGVTTSTRVEFEVTEPYSMGLFLQTLAIAAEKHSGQRNYINAPFLLTCEFVGYDQDGNMSSVAKRYLVIKLLNVTFDVSEAGSKYHVEAYPWNHHALTDVVQNIQQDMHIQGATVAELLTTGEESLMNHLNRREAELVETCKKDVGDVYEIRFPTEVLAPVTRAQQSAPLGDVITVQPLPPIGSTQEQIAEFNRLNPPVSTSNPRTYNPSGELVSSTESLVNMANSAINRSEAVQSSVVGNTPDDSTENSIANSRVSEQFNETGTNPMAAPDELYDEGIGVVDSRSAGVSQTVRSYQFKQNTKIEVIIEEVIKSSDYAKTILERAPDERGCIDWFRIHTKVETVNITQESKTNRPAYKYIYEIYPYKVNKSLVTPATTAVDYTKSINDAVKAYNYTYTGENVDILNFEIKIDYAFFQAAFADNTQMNREVRNGKPVVQEGQTTIVGMPCTVDSEFFTSGSPNIELTTVVSTETGGPDRDDTKRRVAEAVNNAIVNSQADIIRLDLTVWGDPYYLSDSDFGNHLGDYTEFNINNDGSIVHYNGEVNILVRFDNAVDIQNNLLDPRASEATNAFNGLYRVLTVKSNFSNGQYTNELGLLRQRNQSGQTVTLSNAMCSSSTVNRNQLRSLIATSNSSNFSPFLTSLENGVQKFSNIQTLDVASIERLTGIDLSKAVEQFDQVQSSINQVKQMEQQVRNTIEQIENAKTDIERQVSEVRDQFARIRNIL